MIIDFYNRGGGSGGGVTTGQVQTMIDTSISGKADTSAVTEDLESKQNYYTATTLSSITNPKEGDVCIVSEVATEIEGANPNNVDFLDTVAGKKVRVAFNSEGLTNGTIAGYTINNSGYWGWGYTAGTVNSRNTTTGDWESWNGSNYEYTFPSRIISYNRNIGNNINVWLQRSTISIVEENVVFNYVNGQWIRLMDTIEGMIDEQVQGLADVSQMVYESDWTGFTPSQVGLNEGTILNHNGVYGEVFNGEDSFLERKGFYNRTFSGTTDLSATTGNDGDCYKKVTIITGTGSTWVEVDAEEFATMCAEGTFTAGTTYRISADTSTTPSVNKAIRGGFTTTEGTKYLGFGYRTNGGWGIELLTDSQSWSSWDGSSQTFTIPEFTVWQLYMYNSPTDVVTVEEYSGSTETVVEDYTMINGEWSKTYRQVMISQADYDLIQTKDPNTIYNITGTTS